MAYAIKILITVLVVLGASEIGKRMPAAGASDAAATIVALSIAIDPATDNQLWSTTWQLAERHRLTIYDAAYLELALRVGAPLATKDKALIRAAAAESVTLFGR